MYEKKDIKKRFTLAHDNPYVLNTWLLGIQSLIHQPAALRYQYHRLVGKRGKMKLGKAFWNDENFLVKAMAISAVAAIEEEAEEALSLRDPPTRPDDF